MPRYRTFQTSFTAGEFDQKLRDRTDIKAFFEGSQLMRNYALLSQGGFTRRPGTFLLSEVQKGRIIPFEYSARDALIINLYNGGIEVLDLSGQFVQQSITSPFLEDELFEVKYVQRGNGLIFAHRNHPTQILTRNPDNNTFTLAPLTFGDDGNGVSQQPYASENVGNTVKFTVANSVDGSAGIWMRSDMDYFTPEHNGTIIRLEEGYATVTAYVSPTEVTVNQTYAPRRNVTNDSFQTSNGSATVLVNLAAHSFSVGQEIRILDVLPTGGINQNDLGGVRTVSKVVDSNRFEYTAGAAATSSVLGGGSLCYISYAGPTTSIKEQAFSSRHGYPGAVTIHEERLWLGGTVRQPDSLFSSHTGQFDNFGVGDGLPSESIQIRIEAGSVNEIRHLVSSRHLQILTNDNEFYAPSSDQQPLTPETFVVRKQTPFGASQVRASLFDGATIFTQESGRSVREFLYTDREFAYNARNIALLSQHLIEDPKDLQTIYGGLTRPEQYAFFLNSTGTLTVLHAIRSEEIIGWAQWQTDGTFEGIAVVGQRVFVVVARMNDQDQPIHYLEEMDFAFNYFMDGIIGFSSGTPATVWGPAPEYANQEVAVTTGNYFLGYFMVDDQGYIETPDEYESLEIGLNFVAIAKTMQATFQLPDGPMTGIPIRLTRTIVDFGQSNTMYVDGQRLIIRKTEDPFPHEPPDPFDSKQEFWLNNISRNPSVEFYSDIPLSVTVYSAMIEIAF